MLRQNLTCGHSVVHAVREERNSKGLEGRYNPLPGVGEMTLHSLLILGISLTRDKSYTSQRGPLCHEQVMSYLLLRALVWGKAGARSGCRSREAATGEKGIPGLFQKRGCCQGKLLGNRFSQLPDRGQSGRPGLGQPQGHSWSTPGHGFMAWAYVTSLCNIIKSRQIGFY